MIIEVNVRFLEYRENITFGNKTLVGKDLTHRMFCNFWNSNSSLHSKVGIFHPYFISKVI